MDTIIDPLDLEPHINAEAVRSKLQYRVPPSGTRTEGGESFDEVLRKEVKQEPTPIRVPKPLSADVHLVPERANPIATPLASLVTQNAPPLNTDESKAQPTASEPSIAKNLREMPEPKPSADTRSETSVVPKTPSVVLNETILNESNESSVAHETVSDKALEPPQDESLPLSPPYFIQPGDTLSDIVAERMKRLGIAFTVSELYQTVKTVAQHNALKNPDRIYVGQTLDLSPIQPNPPEIAKRPQENTAVQAASRHIAEITSGFGIRRHPVLDEIHPHNGIDLRADAGTPVLPPKAGVVTFSGEQRGYGEVIDVDHGDGTQTRYAHLSERLVSVGDPVSPLQPLGLSGATGRVTAPHLHFEYHQNGIPVDPQNHIRPEQLLAPTSPLAQQQIDSHR